MKEEGRETRLSQTLGISCLSCLFPINLPPTPTPLSSPSICLDYLHHIKWCSAWRNRHKSSKKHRILGWAAALIRQVCPHSRGGCLVRLEEAGRCFIWIEICCLPKDVGAPPMECWETSLCNFIIRNHHTYTHKHTHTHNCHCKPQHPLSFQPLLLLLASQALPPVLLHAKNGKNQQSSSLSPIWLYFPKYPWISGSTENNHESQLIHSVKELLFVSCGCIHWDTETHMFWEWKIVGKNTYVDQ